jgi:hypothetical protein
MTNLKNGPRCFMLESTKFDTSALVPKWAATDDDLIYLFDAKINPRPSTWSGAFQSAIVRRLNETKFDPETDYIVGSGHFIPVTIMLGVIGMVFDSFSVLHFSPAERSYSHVRMDCENFPVDAEAVI